MLCRTTFRSSSFRYPLNDRNRSFLFHADRIMVVKLSIYQHLQSSISASSSKSRKPEHVFKYALQVLLLGSFSSCHSNDFQLSTSGEIPHNVHIVPGIPVPLGTVPLVSILFHSDIPSKTEWILPFANSIRERFALIKCVRYFDGSSTICQLW